MESDRLYKVKKEDFGKLEQLLTRCFIEDPLYCQLIPDHQMREKLLPELFDCDLTEFYENCEIFADSEEMRGILVVSDEAEPYNIFKYFLTEAQASLRTDGFLIREDPSPGGQPSCISSSGCTSFIWRWIRRPSITAWPICCCMR